MQYSQAHPCNHGVPSGRSLDDPLYTPPGPSSEVIIALQGGFLLYGCHNYIVSGVYGDMAVPKCLIGTIRKFL